MLVLASASTARARLLENAGVPFTIDPAHVDEDAIKTQARGEGLTATDTALALSDAKALAVSAGQPNRWVLGADQMLACDGVWYDKPSGRAGAARQLMALRGRTHKLISAVSVATDGAVVWRLARAAHLTMRRFDNRFLETYLDACGETVLGSVGAYHLEGRGAQLFDHIDGDYFTILGLPLLDVLAFLRTRNLL